MKNKHQSAGAFFCSLKQALSEGTRMLKNSPSAALDSQVLLCFVLDKDPAYLYTWPDKTLSEEEHNKFISLIKRRKAGEPVAYITGEKEFYGISFKVNPNVLIPRPETELIVEEVLKTKRKYKILDICCGSGAIGLTLKKNLPESEVTLADISKEALDVARENAKRLGLEIKSLQSNLFENIEERYDIITANPPYISEDEYLSLERDITEFEPKIALTAGEDGLEIIKKIAQQVRAYLKPKGRIIIEFGYNQEKTVKELLERAGFKKVKILKDLSGCDRIAVACQ